MIEHPTPEHPDHVLSSNSAQPVRPQPVSVHEARPIAASTPLPLRSTARVLLPQGRCLTLGSGATLHSPCTGASGPLLIAGRGASLRLAMYRRLAHMFLPTPSCSSLSASQAGSAPRIVLRRPRRRGKHLPNKRLQRPAGVFHTQLAHTTVIVALIPQVTSPAAAEAPR